MDISNDINTQLHKTCCFFGHRDVLDNKTVLKNRVADTIRSLIEDGFSDFLLGGYGEFDALCYSVLKHLKAEFAHIKIGYVQAYYKHNEELNLDKYDFTIYPSIEGKPLKFAITFRNEKIIEMSQFCIFYVKRDHGGAYKALLHSKRKNVPHLNLA